MTAAALTNDAGIFNAFGNKSGFAGPPNTNLILGQSNLEGGSISAFYELQSRRKTLAVFQLKSELLRNFMYSRANRLHASAGRKQQVGLHRQLAYSKV